MSRCSCDTGEPCLLVVLGASGDLTKRKLLPALFDLELRGELPGELAIVGVARSDYDDESWRLFAEQCLRQFRPGEADTQSRERFMKRLHYVSGNYDDPKTYQALGDRVKGLVPCGDTRRALLYLALPPSVVERVIPCLRNTPLTDASGRAPAMQRLMIEKPFGTDLESSHRVNAILHEVFDEEQIYRIDHYLAKDTVRNFMVFRFANAIFEPLWNRNYIDHVQITAAESIGIEGRGAYYEEAGVVRDMIQNHVLQVLAMVAMEPPLAADEESIRTRKHDVFQSLRPLDRQDFSFGQYEGYLDEKGVAHDSTAPTFATLKAHIDNWRWQGVPFYVRSGKAMPEKRTEVTIQFHTVPLCILGDDNACAALKPNVLRLTIQPDEGIGLSFNAQRPGGGEGVGQTELGFDYANFGSLTTESYAKVLLDGFAGRPSLFWPAQSVEAAWRYVAPMLTAQGETPSGTIPLYPRGEPGPACANEQIRADGRHWHR